MIRTVISAVDDMLFSSKIRATAENLGVNLRSVRSMELVLEVARETQPELIIVDLHSVKVDPITLAQTLKSDRELATVPLLGFFSHVQTDLRQAALLAGFDVVIPRSVFSRDLVEILKGKAERFD